jgi:hypothetical protein
MEYIYTKGFCKAAKKKKGDSQYTTPTPNPIIKLQ